MGRAGKIYGLMRLAARIALFALTDRRRPLSLADRLQMVPRRVPGLGNSVRIRWSDQQIPFIEAGSDADLAAGLGVVHAHLRLAQMEIMRRIALGRLSEVLGPVAVELDHALRIVGIPRAVPAIRDGMPAETAAWVRRFTDGINAAIAQAGRLPEEFRLFGIRPEAWSVDDVLAIGRLAAVDFSWRVWHRLLSLQDRPDWTHLWTRIVDQRAVPVPSFAGSGLGGAADALWASLGRPGSNAAAVAASRSATGGALLTSDPHLPVMLPSPWLAAGMSSPDTNAVGLMIPGLPMIVLGRTRHVAWSGTNLHAASSDLFDVDALPDEHVRERRVQIAVRWGRPQTVSIREADHGPIVTDSTLIRSRTRRSLAMSWIGHRHSDEMTAMLRAMHARSWEDFLAATELYAVPALNLVFADAAGGVGQSMGAHLPRRPANVPTDLAMEPAALSNWDAIVTSRELPQTYDPPEGFVASANDRPRTVTTVPVGFFFSPEERITRLRTVLGANGSVTVADLMALHQDVAMPSAPAMRDLLLAAADRGTAEARPTEPAAAVLAALRDWDARHDANSRGALAFELMLYHFLHRLHGEDGMTVYRASTQPWGLLSEDVARIPAARIGAAAAEAAEHAADAFAAYGTWGEMHRLKLEHALARLPVIGRRYVFADRGVGGSNETLMKTAHGLSAGRHTIGFGANARFIADMANPDANHVVLLGGQDGWLGSSTFADQLDLFQRGEYLTLPLTPEGARRAFPHETVLTGDGMAG